MLISTFYRFLLLGIALIWALGCKETTSSNDKANVSLIDINVPTTTKSLTPYLYNTADSLYLSWQEQVNDSTYSLNYAVLQNQKFETLGTIASGQDWFINWADYPVFVKNNEGVLAHHLQKSSIGTYTYDVMLSLKSSIQSTWSKPFKLHSDSTKSEHGFVSTVALDNRFFVSWLDGRKATKKMPSDERAMTLRGAFVSNDGEILNEVELDNRVCDCCQTTTVNTQDGPLVFYRDRSKSTNETRDIYYVKFNNKEWTAPQKLFEDNWLINGCPVNGPNADAFKNTVAVAWFTAANDNAQVKVSFSTNNGETFQQPIKLDLGNPIGRVNLELINENEAVISWMEQDKILLRRVDTNGKLGKVIMVVESSSMRATGFPQIAYFKDKLYLATTEVGRDKNTRIKIYQLNHL